MDRFDPGREITEKIGTLSVVYMAYNYSVATWPITSGARGYSLNQYVILSGNGSGNVFHRYIDNLSTTVIPYI